MKRRLKILLFVVGILFFILLLVSALAGPIAKRYVEKHSVEWCNRQVSIDRVGVNIFTGTIKIKKLWLPEIDNKTEFLSFEKLRVDLSLVRLLGKQIYFQHVLLDNFKAKVIQKGTQFNFSDIIELYANKPKEDSPSSPWKVEFHDISIRNSASIYEDDLIGSSVAVQNMDIDVSDLYLDDKDSHIKASMRFKDAGSMSTTMTYNIKKGNFEIENDLRDFDIQSVKPYLLTFLNIDKLEGRLTSLLKVKGTMKDVLNMIIKGTVSLQDVVVTDAEQSPVVDFSSLCLEVERINLKNKIFNINKIIFDDWNLYYEINQESNSIDRLLKSMGKDTVSSSDSSISIEYRIDSIAFGRGSVSYKDLSIHPVPQTYKISDLSIVGKNIKTGEASPILITASLGKSGKMEFNATADIANLRNASINLNIQNVDITEFTPYSLHYLSYPVDDGMLNFQDATTIRDGWLDSQNKLDIYKPCFGKKDKSITPAAAKLPMRAALYVITDRKGHVQMDLPVSGNVKSPDFSYRKIIWKTFTNLLVKIATSPVDFMMQTKENNPLKPMTIDTLATQLTVEQSYQLNEIANLLNEKSEMKLEVSIPSSNISAVENRVDQYYGWIVNYLILRNISKERISLVVSQDHKENEKDTKVLFNIVLPE